MSFHLFRTPQLNLETAPELFWFIPFLIKTFTYTILLVSWGSFIVAVITQANYFLFTLLMGLFTLGLGVLLFYKKYSLVGVLLLSGLFLLIFLQAFFVKSAMVACLIGIVLIVSSIITNTIILTIYFLVCIVIAIIFTHFGIFTVDQTIIPGLNIALVNNTSIFYPVVIISYVIGLVIQNILFGSLEKQHHQLIDLKIAQDKLVAQAKIESIQQLAGGIAHDFNNLLMAIVGNVDLLYNSDSCTGEVKESLADVMHASLQARNLANQLLVFSKGSNPIKKTIDNIDELISQTATFSLSGRKARVQYDFSLPLWPIYADPNQIAQVIQNIVINADDAMPNGGTLYISAINYTVNDSVHLNLKTGSYIKVEFRDTGSGIAPEILQKLFTPYFTTKKSGSGLGLIICKSIIETHGGMIKIDTEVGKGTTFTIFIPASPEAKVSEIITQSISFNKPLKILILEDNPIVSKTIQTFGPIIKCKVDIVPTVKECVDRYQKIYLTKDQYDVVILDLTIPGEIGGKEAIVKLQSINPEVKAIASSGYSDDPIINDPKKYGFDSFLKKPYTVNELSLALKSLFP